MGLVELTPSDSSNAKQDSQGNKLITEDAIVTATKNTFTNKTAISPNTYPEIFGTLMSYTEGVPIIVEYFKKRIPYINKETGDLSFSLERAAVHSSYDLIHNFEMRIQGELEIVIDPETTETSINGEAIIYPGFNPNIGDLFYLRLPDDQIGLFLVDLAVPLSISRATQYKVNFHLYSFVDTITDDKLRDSVAEELWFDKQHYFDGEVTLLEDTTYKQLDRMTEVRHGIIDRILSKFYKRDEKTIIRADGVYDAYVVEFLSNKISVKDSRKDICQLANHYIDEFVTTIWASFLNKEVTRLTSASYTLYDYRHYAWDTNLSNMDNFPIVYLKKSIDEVVDERLVPIFFEDTDTEQTIRSYHFSNRLYYGMFKAFEDGIDNTGLAVLLAGLDNLIDDRLFEDNYSEAFCIATDSYQSLDFFDTHNVASDSNNDIHLPELEYLIFDYLINDNIDIAYLVDKVLVNYPFTKLTDNDQFYYLPVFIHLIDTAINRLK